METLHDCIDPNRHARRIKRSEAELDRMRAAAELQILSLRPPPLPPSRLNLSQTSLPTIPAGAPQPPQPPPFLDLPLEIRRLIYSFALGGRRYHLVHIPQRIIYTSNPPPFHGLELGGRPLRDRI